jgi:hypothetical protein
MAGVLLAVCLAPGFAAGARAQQPAKSDQPSKAAAPARIKLFLKDGSYQMVRSYERQGERVRYYSLERSAWEEIPAALVDWEATRKGEEDARQKLAEIDAKMGEIRRAQIAEEVDVDASLEIAPGTFLPDACGLYVLEGKSTRLLAQNMAEVKRDKGRVLTQIIVPVPIIPSRHWARLPGPRSAIRINTPNPEFFIRLEGGREPELELIRARVKGKMREFASISTWITGDQETNRKLVSVEKWQIARGVFRLTLSESLAPGEYVLAEVIPDEGLNLAVWDFGVDGPAKPPASAKKK